MTAISQNLVKEIQKIRILLANSPPIKVEEFPTANELVTQLMESGICQKHADQYRVLYGDKGICLTAATLKKYFENRIRPVPAYQADDLDFSTMAKEALAQVNGQLTRKDAVFEGLPPDPAHPESYHDCRHSHPRPSDLARSVEQRVMNELLGGDPEKPIDRDQALAWVRNKKFSEDLETIGTEANGSKKIIYHEPHHQLTPGMLLLDQLFRRMVKDVSDEVEKITTPTDGSEAYLDSLQAWVNKLAKGSSPFSPYIYHYSKSGLDPKPDPTRIELFLSAEGKILIATLVVGAWKGGSHSSGHY